MFCRTTLEQHAQRTILSEFIRNCPFPSFFILTRPPTSLFFFAIHVPSLSSRPFLFRPLVPLLQTRLFLSFRPPFIPLTLSPPPFICHFPRITLTDCAFTDFPVHIFSISVSPNFVTFPPFPHSFFTFPSPYCTNPTTCQSNPTQPSLRPCHSVLTCPRVQVGALPSLSLFSFVVSCATFSQLDSPRV